MSDVLVDACSACPSLCAPACPAQAAPSLPRWSPRDMLLAAAAGEPTAARHCTGCGACSAACDAEVPIAALLERARSNLATDAFDTREAAARWHGLAAPGAALVFLAHCGCGAPPIDMSKLSAVLRRHRVHGWASVEGVDCGRRSSEAGEFAAFERIGDAAARPLATIRTLVVGGGACQQAFARHVLRLRLAATHVQLLDDWLARYGVALPRRRLRLAPCRGGGQRGSASAALSPTWPPVHACCGAHGPLADVDPTTAAAAGIALLERAEATEHSVLHVADATCAAHLRRCAAQVGARIAIVDRLQVAARSLLDDARDGPREG